MPVCKSSSTSPSPGKFAAQSNSLSDLPDEIILLIFQHLGVIGPNYEADGLDMWFLDQLPFRHDDKDSVPHPGLRSYPFLGQVCKRWEQLLRTRISTTLLWHQLVVDFGHELVTSIHTPLKWSNTRPSTEDFSAALAATTLSVNKILTFAKERRRSIESLSLCNSEGFWGDEGEYLSLSNKHNFQASHLGYMLGMLSDHLQELRLYNCNDLLNTDQGMWSAVATCTQLRVLMVEGVNFRIPAASVSHLANLKKLEEIHITGEEHAGNWITGLDGLPQSWSSLAALHTLTLRGHQVLDSLPPWLASLPALTNLDVSSNANLNISGVTAFTQLKTLVLQHMSLTQPPAAGETISQAATQILPDLTCLAKSLTALSLSHNKLTRLPAFLSKLSSLRILDCNQNAELQVPASVHAVINALPELAILDFRGIHYEKEDYWSESKCTTMEHLSALAKQLKRRKFSSRVLLDTQ